jgi:hypothetical protein
LRQLFVPEVGRGLCSPAHCQRFYRVRIYRILTCNGMEFTLRGYGGQWGCGGWTLGVLVHDLSRCKKSHTQHERYHALTWQGFPVSPRKMW